MEDTIFQLRVLHVHGEYPVNADLGYVELFYPKNMLLFPQDTMGRPLRRAVPSEVVNSNQFDNSSTAEAMGIPHCLQNPMKTAPKILGRYFLPAILPVLAFPYCFEKNRLSAFFMVNSSTAV